MKNNKMCLIYKSFTFSLLIYSAASYKLHNALNAIVFTTNDLPPGDIHSEYYFGKCASQEKQLLVKHIYEYEDIKDFLVVRAQLDVDKEPSCTYIRAKSEWSNVIRYHAFKFNICICRMVYDYGGEIYVHFYYEWYLPVEMMKEMVWELFFYR